MQKYALTIAVLILLSGGLPSVAKYVPEDKTDWNMMAWIEWQDRLQQELLPKITEIAIGRPSSTFDSHVKSSISFTVDRDGRLTDAHAIDARNASNSYFDLICIAAVQSLQRSPLLRFPVKYGRQSVTSPSSVTKILTFECPLNEPRTTTEPLTQVEIQRLMKLKPNEIHQELIEMSKR